ncbi:hypothetical protein AYJ08_11220 [Brevibacillus sp. SKDU10]|uniref:TerC family protein n=1 Tax=Brevibacillus sp. SKDU10 TaxID=1247872 RepID=UPI0007C9826D|nr:TerC family protein [Brevibacillus sp. SKDU10]OAJ74018.1 hypothetical protein AYJ08_11220 [Brevibacillus sp. SKDU10]
MFETEFIIQLLMIIAIDILLGGDNAVVIAMASRNLPLEQKKKAIFWGTGLAVVVRVIATIAAAYLLQIPFLFVIGGLLLVWISYNLLVEDGHEKDIKAGDSLMAAIRTIVIADVTMGIDNVVAIAGTAHGNMVLIIIGLLISVPIMVWGSTLILKAMDRYAWIPYVGAGILALAAAKMITHEAHLQPFFDANPWISYLLKGVIIVGVIVAGYWQRNRMAKKAMANQLMHEEKNSHHEVNIGS